MKSQDILILLKLITLGRQEALRKKRAPLGEQGGELLISDDWEGWSDDDISSIQKHPDVAEQVFAAFAEMYTARGLSGLLGISKTEVNLSIKRSIFTGLAKLDRETGRPKVNITGLKKFIINGLKYVFPAKLGGITRGIPTSFAAPILIGKLMTAGETIYVWPDPYGKNKGQMVSPLYKSVPYAVRLDSKLYELLALIDAIRLGLPREVKLAERILEELLV